MAYVVYSTAEFDAQIEPLYERYGESLDDAEAELRERLAERPNEGVSLGKGLYQVQLHFDGEDHRAEASVITCVSRASEEVFLIAIYDTDEQRDPTPAERIALEAVARNLIVT